MHAEIRPGAVRMLTDEQAIPTGSERVDGTEFDFRSPKQIGSTQLDTGYSELDRDPDGRARVVLQAPDDSARVTLWMAERYPYLMLFTGDTLPDRPVCALVISDTHFGAWTGEDLLRHDHELGLLAPHLDDVDEVIFLGDLFDFLFSSVRDAVAAADGLFDLLRDTLEGKRLVFAAGNHDHHLIVQEARWHHSRVSNSVGQLTATAAGVGVLGSGRAGGRDPHTRRRVSGR